MPHRQADWKRPACFVFKIMNNGSNRHCESARRRRPWIENVGVSTQPNAGAIEYQDRLITAIGRLSSAFAVDTTRPEWLISFRAL